MKKIYILIASTLLLLSFNLTNAQVNYGSCQTVNSSSPCFFGLYNFYIKNVSFGTLNFSGGDCSGDGTDDGYQDKYATVSGTVTAGNSYTLTITKGGSGGDSYEMAWVDWNNDGDFDDPGEQLFTTAVFLANFSGPTVATINNIAVPLTALNGAHRMRVRSDGGSPATNPCASSGAYGDTKDFQLIVTGGANPACTNVGGTSTATPSSICTGLTSTLTLTGSSGHVQWQQSADGNAPWVNVTGGSGDTMATYTTDVLTNTIFYRAVLSDDTCPDVFSTVSSVTVNPFVTPTINIIASTSNDTVCAGQEADFFTSVTNEGNDPQYAWFVNGVDQQNNISFFSTTTLANGDVVKAVLTSDAACTTVSTAADSITIGVLTGPTPVVTISVAPSDTICEGQSVLFTAVATGAGANPVYQWQLNGEADGPDTTVYNPGLVFDGFFISCTVFSSATCANAGNSNIIIMSVNPSVTPTVTISANPSNDTICAGQEADFTAIVTDEGDNPQYAWFVNGVNQNNNSSFFSSTTLADGDVVKVQLTSNALCATTALVADSVTIGVVTSITPTVTISVSPSDTICQGQSVLFTATVTGAGVNPTYEWQLNGEADGPNTPTYNPGLVFDGFFISLSVFPTASCANPGNSNVIIMSVNTSVTPTISVVGSPVSDTVCLGQEADFFANVTNEGDNPQYNWFVNGVDQQNSISFFSSTSLADGDIVKAQLISSLACADPAVVADSVRMSVLSGAAPVVTISVSPSDTICQGQSVLFSSTVTGAGNNPVYQWQLNGEADGPDTTVYNPGLVFDGFAISLTVFSDVVCASPGNSNLIIMSVNQSVTPDITVSVSPTNDTLCAGQEADFFAIVDNQGNSPQYNWFVNGVAQSNNSIFFSSTSLADGDMVKAELISDAACVSPVNVADSIAVTVITGPTPIVSIAALPSDSICEGQSVTFSSNVTNGGANPVYQWQLDGQADGPNDTTYTPAPLSNGQLISLTVFSDAVCANPGNSNSINIFVKPIDTVAVTVSINPSGTLCQGRVATFTASPVNGGSNPQYQWKVNGTNAGTNDSVFTSTTLADGDVVTVDVTSNENCVVGSPARSTNTVSVTQCLGVTNVADENKLLISPNPSDGMFRISSAERISSVQVFDVEGKMMEEAVHGDTKGNVFTVDLTKQAKGIYMLRAATANGIVNSKLVVE